MPFQRLPESVQIRRLRPEEEERFLSGAREAARFFMNKSNVHRALERLVDRLTELEIPYASSSSSSWPPE
jgi:ubiquinone biosynthesis protein UbiJ